MPGARDIRAGRAFVELGTKDAGLVRGLAAASARVKAWGASLAGTGARLAGIGVAAALPLGAALKTFADYEQALANLRAVANPTAEDFDKLKAAIERTAAATGTGHTETAKIFSELAKAGLPIERIIGDAGQALVQFVRVGEVDVEQATKALVGGLNVFNQQGVSSTKVINSISSAADASIISIKDVVDAFGEGGGIMAGFGQNIDDVNASFAILGKNLILGAEAGTTMKTLFQRLANPVGEVGEGMEQLGLTVQDLRTAEGAFLPLPQLIDKIAAAAEQLDPIARDQALTRLAGARGGRGLAVLLKEGGAALIDMKKQMNGTLTVAEKFEIMSGSFIGQLRRLWVQVEAVAIAFGDSMAPALAVLGGAFAIGLQALTGWIKENPRLTAGIGLAVVAVTALGVAMVATGFVLSGVGSAVGLLVGTLKLLNVVSLASTVIWVAWKAILTGWVGVALLAKGVMLLFNAQLAIWKVLLAGGAVATGAVTVAMLAAKAATLLWSAALTVLNVLLTGAGLLAAAGTIVIIGAALAVAASAAVALYQSVRIVVEALGGLSTAEGPLAHILGLFGEWKGILMDVVAAMKTDMPRALELLKAGFTLVIQQIRDLWTPLWEFIKGGFLKVAEIAANHFQVEFEGALFIVQRKIAIATSIFGIGDEQKRQEIAAQERSLASSRLAAADQLDAELTKLQKKFKVTESDETKKARAELEAKRQELADAGRTSFLGGLGLSAALAQLKDVGPALEEQNKLTRRQQTATTGSLASVANAMHMALGGTTDLKHLRVAEEQRTLPRKLVERGGVGPIFQ